MVIQRVKHKLPLFGILFGFAGVTFLASLGRVFPAQWVEAAYARKAFPTISHVFGVVADALPVSWLDVWIGAGLAILIYVLYGRRWRLLVGTVSFFYLWFFWGWGLNYHRPPLADRLHLALGAVDKSDAERLAEIAVAELNRLWPLASQAPLGREEISAMAAERVARVVLKIDGTDWPTARHVKRSLILEPWYLGAGIDGMFNPFGHEPLVVKGPLPFELPFLMAHELAHVRGIANEGEANLIALLATVASADPRFQYSGWLDLWGYLPEAPVGRLDAGPRADLRAVRERILARRIRFISSAQTAILDAHLKANAVPGGIRSYSDLVGLAIASQPRWKEFE